ncbi:hypothetical protein SDC9_147546 [bioreactor metagenome]|uniref:Uncharacterized protein n=1 Tax=bioreactor metagenome TaxID=1076179 RepID=A0A645EGE7_9ZZZZ
MNPGLYYDSLFSQSGCDSVYILNLIVHPTYEFTFDADICQMETYSWRGNSYSVAGIYYDSLTTGYGCDSVFVLNLRVHPNFEIPSIAYICNHESYIWRGHTLSQTGVYYDSLTTQYGCDSVFILALVVRPTYEFVQNKQICHGSVYQWHGHTYYNSGTYYDSLTTQYGCDSVYILNLIVHPVYEYVTDAAICSNQSYMERRNVLQSGNVLQSFRFHKRMRQ